MKETERKVISEKLDKNVTPLVKALNKFEGIHTIGSCGGHENPKPGQWDAGTFYVNFQIDRTEQGWRALEFLAWIVGDANRAAEKGDVLLLAKSPPPYVNTPGECLSFAVEGYDGYDPVGLAKLLNKSRRQLYIAVGEEEKLDEIAVEIMGLKGAGV